VKAPENIDRRNAVKRLAWCAGIPLAILDRGADTWRGEQDAFGGGIGVCTPLADGEVLHRSGCGFLEERVTEFLAPDKPEDLFLARLAALKRCPLPVPVCRVFLPGNLKCVGNEVDPEALSAYAATAMKRAENCGVKIIVFGSGGARRIPAGFSSEKAREQLMTFLRMVTAAAAGHGVTIALEPLNRGETNLVNTVKEGSEIVEALAHPNLKLLVDIYHMHREGEAADEILRAGPHIRHCHIAEFDKRTAPVTMKDDFRPYFRALKQAGYTGRLSIESSWTDLSAQLPLALAVLRKQITEA
jgi:sugar phosphate isomerase/epimerase